MSVELHHQDRPKYLSLWWKGWRRRCPKCGEGASLYQFLKVVERCDHCHEPLGHIQADDFPPYVTILIVSHIVVPGILLLERELHPSLMVHMAIWPLATILLSAWFLPRVKGVILNHMWRHNLTGAERF